MSGVKPSQFSAATVAAMKTKLGVMTQDEADLRYPKIADGDPTPIYTAAEVDDLLKISNPVEIGLAKSGYSNIVLPDWAFGHVGPWPLTDGRGIKTMFSVTKDVVVNRLTVNVYTAGVFTTDNAQVIGVYEVNTDGVTLNKLIEVTTITWTSSGFKTFTIAETTLLASKKYAFYLLYNSSAQTTAPSIGTFGYAPIAATFGNLTFPPGFYHNLETAMPASVTMTGAGGMNAIPAIFLHFV